MNVSAKVFSALLVVSNAHRARGSHISDGFTVPGNNPACASSSTDVDAINGVMDMFVVPTFEPDTVAAGGYRRPSSETFHTLTP